MFILSQKVKISQKYPNSEVKHSYKIVQDGCNQY